MPFFIKTEIIKKEYLINHDLKQKIINEHIDWKLSEWIDISRE